MCLCCPFPLRAGGWRGAQRRNVRVWHFGSQDLNILRAPPSLPPENVHFCCVFDENSGFFRYVIWRPPCEKVTSSRRHWPFLRQNPKKWDPLDHSKKMCEKCQKKPFFQILCVFLFGLDPRSFTAKVIWGSEIRYPGMCHQEGIFWAAKRPNP